VNNIVEEDNIIVVVIFRHKWLDGQSAPQARDEVGSDIAREQSITQKRETYFYVKILNREKSWKVREASL